MTTATLAEYKRRSKELPADLFIGSLVFFTIAGQQVVVDGESRFEPVKVDPDELEKWFKELGLDEQFLPPRPRKIDAFRRATGDTSRSWTVERDDKGKAVEGVSAELMIREVSMTDELVVRHVVKEMRDRRGQKLSYKAKLATIKFYRGDKKSRGKSHSGEKIKCEIEENVAGQDLVMVKSLIAEVEDRYATLGEFLHSDAMRAVVRNYLVHLNAIAVKASGGNYFVHTTRQLELDKLEQLVKRIGENCVLHQVPLVDTDAQRDWLTKHFQDEVEDDVRLLLKDLAKINERSYEKDGGKVDPNKYAEMSGRYQSLVERASEYTDLLGKAQARSGSALDMALDAITDMVDRLDTPRRKAS